MSDYFQDNSKSQPTVVPQKNRTLIIALLLGAAVLILGGVFIFLLATDDDEPALDDSSVADPTNVLTCEDVGANNIINFESVPEDTNTEGLAISNQFQAQYGVTFETGPRVDGEACSTPVPVLAQAGAPSFGFRGLDADGNNLADTLTPEYTSSYGQWFLTDDGNQSNNSDGAPCTLIINYDVPTEEFSFSIMDIDGGETWEIRAFDVNDNPVLLGGTRNADIIGQNYVDETGQQAGNALPTRLSYTRDDLNNTPIKKVTVTAGNIKTNSNGDTLGFGLAFDNFSPACAEPQPTDLSLIKTKDGIATAEVGDEITYLISVTNESTVTATSVRVKDILPSSVSYVSSDSEFGSYDPTTGLWSIGRVVAGRTVNLNLTVRIEEAGVTIANTAEVEQADQEDIDSTPDNGVPSEDDQDTARIEVAALLTCGDGVLDDTEECDASDPSDPNAAQCSDTCRLIVEDPTETPQTEVQGSGGKGGTVTEIPDTAVGGRSYAFIFVSLALLGVGVYVYRNRIGVNRVITAVENALYGSDSEKSFESRNIREWEDSEEKK